MKKKDYLSILCIIILIVFAYLINSKSHNKPGQYVRITCNNDLIGLYPLSENKTISLTDNTISIKDGVVKMSNANCPDQLCKKQHPISNNGEQIICLPNKIVVSVINSSDPISRSSIYFNTNVTVTIYDSIDEKVLDDVMKICNNYEHICSRTNSSSELYKLNHRLINPISCDESGECYPISESLYNMIKIGLDYCELSNGAFDISIAPLTDLWNFSTNTNDIPTESEIEKALEYVDYRNIVLNEDGTISLKNEHTMIDLGGLAKGYIADIIKDYLVSQGVNSATIALGGNIVCIGDKYGKPFNIGIQKPFATNGTSIKNISITDKSVVTSGIYERYFQKDDVIYHHLLNTKNGYPIQNDILGITVITDKSIDGDCLSTWLFSMGSQNALEYVNNHPDIQLIIVDNNYNILSK